MGKTKKIADTPLKVILEDDQLKIVIGIDTLVFGAERCPLFYDSDKFWGTDKECGPYINVTNKAEFIKDIILALQHEEEDGSGPLSNLFDEAAERAVDDGSIGISYEGDVE